MSRFTVSRSHVLTHLVPLKLRPELRPESGPREVGRPLPRSGRTLIRVSARKTSAVLCSEGGLNLGPAPDIHVSVCGRSSWMPRIRASSERRPDKGGRSTRGCLPWTGPVLDLLAAVHRDEVGRFSSGAGGPRTRTNPRQLESERVGAKNYGRPPVDDDLLLPNPYVSGKGPRWSNRSTSTERHHSQAASR